MCMNDADARSGAFIERGGTTTPSPPCEPGRYGYVDTTDSAIGDVEDDGEGEGDTAVASVECE